MNWLAKSVDIARNSTRLAEVHAPDTGSCIEDQIAGVCAPFEIKSTRHELRFLSDTPNAKQISMIDDVYLYGHRNDNMNTKLRLLSLLTRWALQCGGCGQVWLDLECFIKGPKGRKCSMDDSKRMDAIICFEERE